MLVAIGERINASQWSAAVVDAESESWRRDPIRAALAEEALPLGSLSRARLSRLMGLHPDMCMNVLEPSRTIGSWSTTRARENGLLILAWAKREGHRLLLLGRRVAAAMGVATRARWGTIVEIEGVRCMVLPHPSGRSRALNDDGVRRGIQSQVAEFVEK